MNSAMEVAPQIGIAAACIGLGVPVRRSTARSVRCRRTRAYYITIRASPCSVDHAPK